MLRENSGLIYMLMANLIHRSPYRILVEKCVDFELCHPRCVFKL